MSSSNTTSELLKDDSAGPAEPAMSSGQPQTAQTPSQQSPNPTLGPKRYNQVVVPTHEMIMQEDVMNHPITRMIMSGAMGFGFGGLIGMCFGSFDGSVRSILTRNTSISSRTRMLNRVCMV